MADIKIIGKEYLGTAGFSLLKGEASFANYSEKLAEVRKITGKEKILTTNMTKASKLKELGYNYLPIISKYRQANENLFEVGSVIESCLSGENEFFPNSDFIVWDSNSADFATMTYSRTAPVLFFQAENGMSCLGVVLRPALKHHAKYIFDKIFEALGASEENKVAVTIASVTGKEYDDMADIPMSIIEYLVNLCYQYDCVSSFSTNTIVEENDSVSCYVENNYGNHIVAVV